ncbi:putative DUF890 domain-protein [Phialemonium atrogriseum]|uniref:DUF890 domain-protein n=1 Tax=Phialemonium atrogriseum TaxID=1093897 RepID=A0AAJ0FER4_9PEZI|nr:putative DUF890 domain-protein [Phialemonium atrogriseum]KAK1765851.1 putative DUF890 domain-protein [Phialemonium atrogriseum]
MSLISVCSESVMQNLQPFTNRSLKSSGQLNFSDPKAVMQLTKTLLKLDFGLETDLPDDRLCPPVPNRHNYILWLKELMDSTSYNYHGRKLSGLDVGTGASCIYPLLGSAQRPWNFIGTDIDAKNISYAQKNVKLNGLDDRIRIVARKPSDSLIPLDDLGLGSIDFVMTNPPFYLSEDEMISSAKQKARPPHSACTGAPVEMVCEGGEVAFVGRILAESLVLRDRVQWYTSMFGKVSSAEAFVESLRQNGIDNYAITEFIQGNKTRRWAIGWSFGPMRPSQDAARGIKVTTWKKLLPAAVEVDLCTSPSHQGVGPLADRVAQTVGALELLSWEWEPQKLRGIGRARENVWSRAWRRKKLREEKTGSTHERLTTNTVGLVALSDFRKRRAEVIEQQEREAREIAVALSGTGGTGVSTPDRSLTGTPNNASDNNNSEAERHAAKRKKKRRAKALVSFGEDEGEGDDGEDVSPAPPAKVKAGKAAASEQDDAAAATRNSDRDKKPTSKFTANASVGVVPRALTKAALRREAAERDALRKEFLVLQTAVKATEIAIPFVFYDGTNVPGGVVRVKKGDFAWVVLDKSRKVGAELGVGGEKSANARREWARVGVDDLILVRGSIIIPHHYEIYFFIVNKTNGPGRRRLFDYSAEAPPAVKAKGEANVKPADPLSAPAKGTPKDLPDISTLEGASDDPTFTKVVDRRWYERNKHIYPASVWQEFDPEKDYQSEIRRDPGGNAFFFSK